MFQGIPAGMQPFMAQLRARNEKAWYEAHKPEYAKLVKEPFWELTRALAETVRDIDDRMIVEPRRCVSRPRRDTRFTHDKTLYRSNVWIGFRPAADRWDVPLFFFEVFTDSFQYGLAFLDESPAFMRKLRAYAENCPNDFRTACAEAEAAGLTVTGSRYKKPKEGAPRGLEDWFEYKDFYWVCRRSDNDILQSAAFLPDVERAFRGAAHFYRLLTEVSDFRPEDYLY